MLRAHLGHAGQMQSRSGAEGAALMDQAGLSARRAADQLGHAKVSMTQDNHFGRRVAQTGAAIVLAPLGQLNGELTKNGG